MDCELALKHLGGAGKLRAMINARQFVRGADGSLVVKFRAKNAARADCFKVKLNARDLYDVEFFNLKEWFLMKLENLDVEGLVPAIENALQLRLAL